MTFEGEQPEAGKRGRKLRPVKTELKRAGTGARIVRKFDDEQHRDRAVEAMVRAGEIQDGRPYHSFDEAMKGYLEVARLKRNRRPGDTLDRRIKEMETELVTVFGGRSIRSVTPLAVDRLRSEVITRRGYGAWAYVDAALSNVIQFARSELWLLPEEDPYVELPTYSPPESRLVRRQKKKAEELPLPTLAQIHDMLKNASGWLQTAIYLILHAGLRTGELRALRWRHVQLDHMRRLVTIVIEIAIKHDGKEGPTKSQAGNRRVHVRGPLFDHLAALHPGKKHLDTHVILVPSETEIPQPLQRKLYYHLMHFQTTIGIGQKHHENGSYFFTGTYGPHLLRHAAVAWWIWRGVPDALIQYWIGHADLPTTLGTYGYLFDAQERGDATWPPGPLPLGDEKDDGDEEEIAIQ